MNDYQVEIIDKCVRRLRREIEKLKKLRGEAEIWTRLVRIADDLDSLAGESRRSVGGTAQSA
jgi:hypothetical protein